MPGAMPVERRVESLLSRMSVEEKAGQLTQFALAADAVDRLRGLARSGRLGSCILASSPLAGGESHRESGDQRTADMEQANETQRIAVEESRLGIPLLFGRDIIHGHRTVFPIPLGQAAAWDPELTRRAGSVILRRAMDLRPHGGHCP